MLKKLEIVIRRLGFTLIGWYLALKPKPKAIDWQSDSPRILFLRYDRIGDMLMSTGIFKAIADALPNVSLDVLASRANGSVIANESYLNEVIIISDKSPKGYLQLRKKLRHNKYDVVIDPHGAASFTSMIYMWLSGAKHRIGLADRGIDHALTIRPELSDRRVHVINYLKALVSPLGIDINGYYPPQITLTSDEITKAEQVWHQDLRPKHLLMNVCAGKEKRRWQPEKYAAVLQHIQTHYPDVHCLVMGVRDEKDHVSRVLAGCHGVDAIYPSSIRDALALVKTADYVFTPDTSIAHAVSCFSKNAVVIFYKDNSLYWGLYGSDGIQIESETNDLASLELPPVLTAVDTMLRPD